MKRRGQALVELALVAPVMLTMMAITLEFGWYFYTMYYMNTAVRLAARMGAAQSAAQNNISNSKVQGCVTNVGGPIVAALDGPVTITVRNPSNMGATIDNTTRPSGHLFTVEARAVYWPFTRIVDLRNFGMPPQLVVNSTFIIR